MKQIIMAALLISFSWGIRAQQLQIRGKVIDLSDKSPLEFANITLQTADSAFITGTTTDSKGLFPDSRKSRPEIIKYLFPP